VKTTGTVEYCPLVMIASLPGDCYVNTNEAGKKEFSRRSVLKGMAALGGAAVGSTSISGFPMVWANKLKDLTLRHVGPAYSVINDIGEQASKDLGFKIEMQSAGTDAVMTRVVNQPETVDIADLEFWAMRKVWPSRRLQSVNTARIKHWDDIVPIFREGKYPDGREVSRQGTLPFEVLYIPSEGSSAFADKRTDLATMLPTIFNADTLGVRPDLVGKNIQSWAELFDAAYRGKTALINVPQIGIMDAAMAIEAQGELTYGNKGNMTRGEIDRTVDILKQLKQEGHFRAFWSTFDESVNLMAAGEVVLQSMWSPAVTVVRTRGIGCTYQPLKEGYRGWGNGMALASHLNGLELEAAYDYLNWYLSGFAGAFIARQGYYGTVPQTTREQLSAAEWDYWYEGKPATVEIKDPFGNLMEKPGTARDGGSFTQRCGNFACWNTVMDEDRYLVKRWNEFTAS
jgi:putative spermidine/putrescine transport system substrate-binding protein